MKKVLQIAVLILAIIIAANSAFAYTDGKIFKFSQLKDKLENSKEDIRQLVLKRTEPTFPNSVKESSFEIVADDRPFFIHILTYHEELSSVQGKSKSFVSFWEKVDGSYICRGSKIFLLYDITVNTNNDTIIISGKKTGFSDEFLHYAFKVGFSKLFYYYIIELRYKPNVKEPYRIDRSKEDYKALKALPIEKSTRKSDFNPKASASIIIEDNRTVKTLEDNESKEDNKTILKNILDNDSKPLLKIYSSDGLQKDSVHYLYKWGEYMKQISIEMHEPI